MRSTSIKQADQTQPNSFTNSSAGLKRPAVPVLQNKSDEASSIELLSQENDPLRQEKTSQAGPENPDTNSTQKPIQRKVGFEFQAYNSVTYRDAAGLTAIQGGKVVGNGNGFTVEHDHGATDNEMEIVTAPVDENVAGRGQLQAQMADIQALTTGIVNGQAVNALGAGGVNWLPRINNYNFHVNNAINFHPQSTIGIKFEKIAELIGYLTAAPSNTGGAPAGVAGPLAVPADPKAALAQQIGWSGQADQQRFKTTWATGLAKARADLAGASDNAISFASLLYGFAEYTQSGAMPGDSSYAKYFMPFMLRLGLLPHFSTLSAADRLQLGRIRRSVLDSPYLPVQPNDSPMEPATIEAILDGFGQDQPEDILLRPGLVGYGAHAHNDGAGLGMNSASDIGPSQTEAARDGAIIELRKLGNDVTPMQLGPFALYVFDLIRSINAPPAPAPALAPLVAPVVAVGGGAANGAAAAGGGGGQNNAGCSCGCFLTTACCEFMGLPDDCQELTTLRWFRDNYLVKLPNGKKLTLLYYQVAPTIVKRINHHRDREEILAYLYMIITTCVNNIRQLNYFAALRTYSVMTKLLAQLFYPEFKY